MQRTNRPRPKQGVCRFYNKPGGCQYGHRCTFTHAAGPIAKTNHAPQPPRAFDVPNADYKTLATWLGLVQNDPSLTLPDSALDSWIASAYALVNTPHIETKQRVVKHLSTPVGSNQIRHLTASAALPEDLGQCHSFLRNRAAPLVKLLSHPDIIHSALLEDAIASIHTVLYGRDGTRGVQFFQSVLAAFGTIEKPDESDIEEMTACVLVLDSLIEVIGTAKIDRNLVPVIEAFSALIAATDSPRTTARLNAEKALQHIEALMGIGQSIPEPSNRTTLTTMATFELAVDGPGSLHPGGPRHDNDHEHINQIEILPTRGELKSLHSDYLPVIDPEKLHVPGLEGLIDRQFRLLREDTVGQLRDAVRSLIETIRRPNNRTSQHDNGAKYGTRVMVYQGVQLRRLQITTQGLAMKLSVQQPYSLAAKSRSERKKWWESSKILQNEALVCLVGPDGFVAFLAVCPEPSAAKNHQQVAQDRRSLYEDSKRATIFTQLIEPYGYCLTRAKNCFQASKRQPLVLCEFPGILLPSFYHTLQGLKRLSTKLDTPFADLLAPTQIAGRAARLDEPPQYARLPGFSYNLSTLTGGKVAIALKIGQKFDFDLLSKHSTLDNAQRTAVVDALSRRLALIQGPPGTGKSFCGGALIRTILANKTAAKLGPIICVCYTNHALDQLLEHLLEDGVSQIIRIGGQSKSVALQAVNLKQVVRGMDTTRTERQQQAIHHRTIELLQGQITESLVDLHNGPSWLDVCHHLERSHRPHHRQLQKLLEVQIEDDGFQTVSYDKRPAEERFLRPRGAKVARQTTVIRPLSDLHDAELSTLDSRERQMLYNSWVEAVQSRRCASLQILLEDLSTERTGLRQCFDERDLRCLSQANIIGLTTSGLARRLDLIRRLPSKVLICEEAGEVLEGHLITALIPSIEHCILIGDHEQLRPRICNYDLEAANPRGKRFSLDMSLFERLIKPSAPSMPRLPFTTLEIQRRMHPSISELVRETLYPKLQDHAGVSCYPPVVGMSRRLFWMDHQVSEDGKDDSTSYSNVFEVDVVAALLQHLVRQCKYEAADIAILTPYLGQLRLLKQRLSSIFEIVVDDRDVNDLEKHGMSDGLAAGQAIGVSKTTLLSTLRLATVDNFQGEEAKVIVVSLVRSNQNKKCGFLKTTNRANVLLSRAKHGMYLVGDSSCYETEPMWAKVLELLRKNNNLGPALELRCPRHPAKPIAVKNADDFARLSPEGGCDLMCTERLNCGHQCPSRCHAQVLHDSVYCAKPCVKARNSCEHMCQKACGDDCGKCEVPIANVRLACDHVSTLPCHVTQNISTARCAHLVKKDLPGCHHSQMMKCADNIDDMTACRAICNSAFPCGHLCTRRCFECRTRKNGQVVEENHGRCSQPCGRNFTLCNHYCKMPCHDGEECAPCQEVCNTSCQHSRCGKKCCEPCAPCAQPCTAGCEHSGLCQLPCAVPCDIMPCSLRCAKTLTCGHRCISTCGEACPSAEFCQICCSDEIGKQTVDWVELTDYREVDLDQNPCFVLNCGHVLTMSSLDGIMGISDHFNLDADGRVLGLKGDSRPFSTKLQLCVNCRMPIANLQRYNRIWRRTILDESTKKFISWSSSSFVPLSQGVDREEAALAKKALGNPQDVRNGDDATAATAEIQLRGLFADMMKTLRAIPQLLSRYNAIWKLRNRILRYHRQVEEGEQPFGRIYNMLRAHRIQSGRRSDAHSRDHTILQSKQRMLASSLSIRCDLAILTDFFSIRREHSTAYTGPQDWKGVGVTVDFGDAYEACRGFLKEATERVLPMQEVEAAIYFSRLVALERGNSQTGEQREALGITGRVNEAHGYLQEAERLCVSKPGSTKGMAAEVAAAQELLLREDTFYQAVSNEEKRAVVAAMSSEFRGTGHWYYCPNGHPFTIGNCGLAREQATCPECGAAVGGMNYQLAEGNTIARDLEQELGRMRI